MDEKFKQSYWDKHGIMRELDEEMTADEIRNWGRSQRTIEKRKEKRAVCPFCLYISTLDKFTALNKNKTVAALLQCPRCGAGMREKTTKVFDKGPEHYSKWFWNKFYLSYKHDKERLIFDKVKPVVREFGFTNTFWSIQKQLKKRYRGESTEQQKERRDGPPQKRTIKKPGKRGPLDEYVEEKE